MCVCVVCVLCVFYVHVTYESMCVCVGIMHVCIAVHMCAWRCWLLITVDPVISKAL